jgi:CTD nuclear envelope phosphatase 1
MGVMGFSGVDSLERCDPLGTLHLYLVRVLITAAGQSCTQLANGSYTKDLTLIESDLARVCLIDNSPISYNVNPGMISALCVFHSHSHDAFLTAFLGLFTERPTANGIPIEGWISDPSDEALLHLLPVLDSLRFASDVRRILGLRIF